jgi:hypothetical protein
MELPNHVESPYSGKPEEEWPQITRDLIARYPLKVDEIAKAVLDAWELIFKESVIGGKLKIGVDVFPEPQILGSFLHELVPRLLEEAFPGKWRRDRAANEKDIVYESDAFYSTEIKTSSHATGVFGNRSFSQIGKARPAKKGKSGYYRIINYPEVHISKKVKPIKLIRFGWIDHNDWAGQVAATGQQAKLTKAVLLGKLITIYPKAPAP